MKKSRVLRKGWKFFAVVLCINLLVFGLTSISSAGSIPSGSYQKSCTNIYYNAQADRITSASCKDFKGNTKFTSLDNAQQCRNNGGDITNCNGSLECTGIGLPSGSYRASCFCCKIFGQTLSCYCRDSKGVPHFTTLQNPNNYTKIWNDNGKLRGGN